MVDAAEGFQGIFDETEALYRLGDILGVVHGAKMMFALDAFDQRLGLRGRREAIDDQVTASAGKGVGEPEPDAASRAGNDRDSIAQRHKTPSLQELGLTTPCRTTYITFVGYGNDRSFCWTSAFNWANFGLSQ